MRWTEEKLSSLPIEKGYRLRGENMTRIEVFSDAAFAFAVTMLVISLSSIPESYQELIEAMKKIPSFGASFAVMMTIWIAHRRWSQRFGLDDGMSTFLTLALIFVVLVYVYPLKLVMDLMFYGFSSSWFPTDFVIPTGPDVAGLITIFGIGFFMVAIIQLGLYAVAKSKADELRLNELEILLVKNEQLIWLVQAVFGLIVIIISISFRSSYGYLAGIVFGLVPALVPLVTFKTRKQIKATLHSLKSPSDES